MPEETHELVEHFFRHEAANLVAVLTRTFGFSMIDVIEDMVQESMIEALRSWRLHGAPDNPAGWLHRVARNRIIDSLRRERTHAEALDSLLVELPGQRRISFEQEELEDSLLRMIFACCHPCLDRESQLPLTLKVLCGFGDREIARGLLISPEAAKKRIARAKRKLQLSDITLELPPQAALHERLDAVHEVLYLMFNEGYCTTRGKLPVEVDLCEEAARLCHRLCESDLGVPTTRALMALMLFHAARLQSRMNDEGAIVLLQEQDRSQWDRDMMRVAEYWLGRSVEGREISRFHLEAGIARLHCRAESIETTDWQGVVRHYDLLLEAHPSPMYVLNRAVALAELDQTEKAEASLQPLLKNPKLKQYPLLYCTLAHILIRSGRRHEAIEHLGTAFALVQSPAEKRLISNRIEQTQIDLAAERQP